jgi:hypothetical protein
MTKLPTWKQIADQKEMEVSYLLRRCLKAEGKDPDDAEALVAIISDAQEWASTQV